MRIVTKITKENSAIGRLCELPDEVSGLIFTPPKGVIFYESHGGAVGLINDDGTTQEIDRRIEIDSPIGMCNDKWGAAIFQPSPDMLWKFSPTLSTGARICGNRAFNEIKHLFPRDARQYTPIGLCRTSPDTVLMALPWCHKILVFDRSQLAGMIGSGKKGFASSSHPMAVRFDSPSGICVDAPSGMTLISDTGNAVVRMFKGAKEVAIIGRPNVYGHSDGDADSARFSKPATIRAELGRVFVADESEVRCFEVSTLCVSTVYVAKTKIIDLAVGGGSIYILEDGQ